MPSEWLNECVKNSTVTNHNGAESDITITKLNTANEIWTQQLDEECGRQGQQIFVDYESIISEDSYADEFNFNWMKYRFGVYDIKCSTDSLCAEARETEPLTQQGLFKNHNKYVPSKQNQFCDRQDPMEMILDHKDFNDHEKTEFAPPIFNYVKKAMTRYMIIVDDTSSVSFERDTFSYLHDAFRKFIEKDLSQGSTEVGIHLLSENRTKEDQGVIKPLNSMEFREEILANFWYSGSKFGNLPKCMIFDALTRSINLLKERSKRQGNANNIIFIIAPGMNKCSDEEKVLSAANDENIKIITLNYPAILAPRISLQTLAYKTNGKAFTVLERKQNEQQSLLSTFFELTTILQHISTHYASDRTLNPVEIYRRELIDTVSREDNKPTLTLDSFNVDEDYEKFKFFVYIYERRERNLEKGMKLISPNNKEYSTLSELRAEYHQIEILGNFTVSGR